MRPRSTHKLAAFCALAGIASLPVLYAADQKLSEDERIELIRGLTAEYATVKMTLPRSPKPLPVESDGSWDNEPWAAAGKYGRAAKAGDIVEITKVSIENDKIVLEINYGAKGRAGHWYDHVQGGMGTTTVPISQQQQGITAEGGTSLALLFKKPVPPLKADDIKKMLAPVLTFGKETVTENYVDNLPAPVQKAIKQNKALVGMDRDQVLLALGRPRHKERNVSKDGTETEDWIYGDPPGKITFVTFAGSKVIRINEAYADIGGSTAPPLAVQ